VLSHLPHSAPGPDGIPFAALRSIKHLLAPILWDVVQGMISGTELPYVNFNLAFLTLLPKTDAEILDPGNTRPLSIVDTVNRLLASIFQVALERKVVSFIHKSQRGFIRGRSMLRNILEIDLASQTVSIKHRRGVLILFDFKAAFPSLSHDFLWDALQALGLPLQYVDALRLFYIDNKHILRLSGFEMDSIVVRSGVRQGALFRRFFLRCAPTFSCGRLMPTCMKTSSAELLQMTQGQCSLITCAHSQSSAASSSNSQKFQDCI